MATSKQTHPNQEPILISFNEQEFNRLTEDMDERAKYATILTDSIKRELSLNPSKQAMTDMYADNYDTLADELKEAISSQLGTANVGRLISQSLFEIGVKNMHQLIHEHKDRYRFGVNSGFDFDGDTWTVRQDTIDELRTRLSNYVDTPGKHQIYNAHMQYVGAVQNFLNALKDNSGDDAGIVANDFARFMLGTIQSDDDKKIIPKHLNYNAFK